MTEFDPKYPFIINDLVIKEEICNLACSYCLTGQSNFKAGHDEKRIFNPPVSISLEVDSPVRKALDRILAQVKPEDVPVLKLSGGEVMLMRGFMEFLEGVSAHYETVTVLTNGAMLTPQNVALMRSFGNVVLQVSLDSIVFAGNSYRISREDLHEKIVAKLEMAISAGLPCEIYLVLNDRSLPHLEETFRYFCALEGDLSVFPFPVRGPDREEFLPYEDTVSTLRKVIENLDQFSHVAPCRAYMERLTKFFENDGRQFRCHLPRVAFGSFDDGTVTSCPNIWFDKAGNLLESDGEDVFRSLRDAGFRKLLLADRPRVAACKTCLTPWDPVSLFFDGEIDLDELCKVPIYRGQHTRSKLKWLARRFGVAA